MDGCMFWDWGGNLCYAMLVIRFPFLLVWTLLDIHMYSTRGGEKGTRNQPAIGIQCIFTSLECQARALLITRAYTYVSLGERSQVVIKVILPLELENHQTVLAT